MDIDLAALKHWVTRLSECQCHINGPDGIECPVCELKKLVSVEGTN